MNRLLRISGACSVAALMLALLAADSPAQTWTASRTPAPASAIVPTSGISSDDGPTLGNTQSQWTPRFQPPRSRINRTGATEPFVEDEAANAAADAANGQDAVVNAPAIVQPPRASAYRNQSTGNQYYSNPPRARSIPAGADYTPQWQRSPRMAMANPPGGGRRVNYNGQPTRRVAQAGGPGQVGAPRQGGPQGSPFVEDEIVPQGTRAPLPDGEVQFQNEQAFDGIADGTMVDGDGYDPSCGPCDPSCGPCDPCCGPCDPCCGPCFDPCCEGGYDPTQWERFHVCCPLGFLNELSFNSGVQAFKAPVDNGRNSNFGAHAGFNAGDAIWHHYGIGYQVGAQFIESNVYGDQTATGAFSAGSRRQVFITAGLFHRAFYNYGWQGGVVVDYLNDNYYYSGTMYQIRAELSHLFYGGHEFGSWIAANSRNQQLTFLGANQSLQSVDLYTFFYRRNFASGTQGRVWAGFTGPISLGGTNSNASAIVGADFRMALSNRWDFTGIVNYLPSTQGGLNGQQAESWAISMNLVFYPARFARGVHNGPYRPLFNVADNSVFFVNRKR
ncbi:MAG TPA: DUF6666 family protein [Pirellulales bacterium]|jgi:hypothetical protein|nr:DUF6666 family protein [Pirellulales bacterium]